MANKVTALTIFEQKAVAPAMQKRILELDPKFANRSTEDQEELIAFLVEQAQKTVEGVRSRFPMIQIRHAGSKSIELPKIVGQEDPPIVREFDGIIVDQYLTKAYWATTYGEGSSGPPDCASIDGITPYVKNPISATCITCPFNKFGSGVDRQGAETRGKRCRDQKRVIIKLPEHELPCRLMVSAANIGSFDTYMSALRDQGTPIGTVITKFRAVEAKSAAGVEFTGIEFNTTRQLSMDEILDLKRTVITPFGEDFRIGAIESNEDSGDAGPSRDDVARGTGQRAADVM